MRFTTVPWLQNLSGLIPNIQFKLLDNRLMEREEKMKKKQLLPAAIVAAVLAIGAGVLTADTLLSLHGSNLVYINNCLMQQMYLYLFRLGIFRVTWLQTQLS
jgi:hypothetical protein